MNLVTGATGILGSHVVLNLLRLGQEVVAVSREKSDRSKIRKLFALYLNDNDALYTRIRWIDLDVTDYFGVEAAIKGVRSVYHCAGMVSLDPADRKKLFKVNQEGTANVVNACLYHGGIDLCHVSSIATISNSDADLLDETVFWKKSGSESDYALSKYNGEREVWRGISEGLQAVIVNPGVLISPVFWEQSSGAIFNRCYKGNRFFTTGSTAYISADDASKAMIALMEIRKYGNRYILSEGNYSYRLILSEIQLNFGKQPPAIAIGRWGLRILAIFERFIGVFRKKGPLLTNSVVQAALNRQIYSNAKIRNTLDFPFRPIKEVIREACVNYKTVSARS